MRVGLGGEPGAIGGECALLLAIEQVEAASGLGVGADRGEAAARVVAPLSASQRSSYIAWWWTSPSGSLGMCSPITLAIRSATALQRGPRVCGIGSRCAACGAAGAVGTGLAPQPFVSNVAPRATRSWCSVM